MDEREWLACTDPKPMLRFLDDRASDRQVRLFVCSAARRVWDRVGEREKENLEACESYAEGSISLEGLKRAWGVEESYPGDLNAMASGTIAVCEDYAARKAEMPFRRDAHRMLIAEEVAQTGLLRCIFGNPFRPVAFDPALRTPAVLALAQAAYDNRTLPAGTLEHDRLAVLADALEEAGCTNAEILAHLRSKGPHVRGCWVVDLLLEKA